jgi:NADH-quinone oxidoreductase subunit L
MTVALGVSAYSAGMFHLMTHAFFKALLFLAAGSVIIGMHHEQDMRKMGGLGRYMPITAITCWIGALALIGTPFFAGFYSKDAIIDAVHESHRWGAGYAYWCVLVGVFVTALYTFRMLFMTFHGPERFRDTHAHAHGHESDAHEEPCPDAHGGAPHESPWVVTVPLVALAIPSVVIGAMTVGSVLYGSYFGRAIFVLPANNVVEKVGEEFGGWLPFALHGFFTLPFAFALAGVVTAWIFFLWRPALADAAARRFGWLQSLLDHKYYFDWVNENVLAPLTRGVGLLLWKGGDEVLIDGALVNGTAATVGWFGGIVRRVQSGYLYSYAFWMMIGLALMIGWFLHQAHH